jgi:hypothetical protein
MKNCKNSIFRNFPEKRRINNMSRGIFVTGHVGTLFQKFSHRRRQAGTVFWNFLSWHRYKLPPPPLRQNFMTSMRSGTYFL